MKRRLHDFRWRLAAALIMMTAVLTGCRYLSIPSQDDAVPSLLSLKGEKGPPAYNSAVIKGRLTGPGWRGNSTLILACSPADKKK